VRTTIKHYQSVAVILIAAIVLSPAIARTVESEIDHLVHILELKRGYSVADVGAGSGEVSVAMAQRLGPEGKVYSTEIEPKLVAKIRNNSEKAGTSNVIPIEGTEHDTGLPSNCCDAIFLREVYHHLTDPIGIDRDLYRAMRTGARLAIIDFEPTAAAGPAPLGIPANRGGHGVRKTIVAEELTQTGFELVKAVDWPISAAIKHYLMLFRKPPAKRAPSVNRKSERLHP